MKIENSLRKLLPVAGLLFLVLFSLLNGYLLICHFNGILTPAFGLGSFFNPDEIWLYVFFLVTSLSATYLYWRMVFPSAQPRSS